MIEKRFCVVPMPLTVDGHGPASDEETASMTYEVWDRVTNLSLASFTKRSQANVFASTADLVATVTTYLRSIGE